MVRQRTRKLGLGRRHCFDERDRRFRMASPPTERTFRNWLSPGPIWDQGWTSQCVAYATNRYLISHPIVNKIAMPHKTLYHEAQLIDEWPGEDYDGTSVRAAFKVLKRLGYVESYGWGYDIETIIRHILSFGPVVMGTDWTWDMDNPDEHGYVYPTGGVAGGHAFMVPCANRLRKNPDNTIGAFRIFNSWSKDWGQNGKAWISFDAMEMLIKGLEWPGEACTAKEIDIS